LETNHPHKFVGLRRLFGKDTQLIRQCLTELLVGDGQRSLQFPLHNSFAKELAEGFWDFAFHQFRDRLESISGVLELLKVFKFNAALTIICTVCEHLTHR
jgi:hypothetical protein